MHKSMERQNFEDHMASETAHDIEVGTVEDFMGTDIDRARRIEALALAYRTHANRYFGRRRAWRLRRADELIDRAYALIGLTPRSSARTKSVRQSQD